MACGCLLDNSFHSATSPSGGFCYMNAPDCQMTDDSSPSPGGRGRGEGWGEGEREFQLNRYC